MPGQSRSSISTEIQSFPTYVTAATLAVDLAIGMFLQRRPQPAALPTQRLAGAEPSTKRLARTPTALPFEMPPPSAATFDAAPSPAVLAVPPLATPPQLWPTTPAWPTALYGCTRRPHPDFSQESAHTPRACCIGTATPTNALSASDTRPRAVRAVDRPLVVGFEQLDGGRARVHAARFALHACTTPTTA